MSRTIDTKETAIEALAIVLCKLAGIEAVDSTDGSANWWMFNEPATKMIDDLEQRGFGVWRNGQL